jgi:hypothetical protein
LLDPNHVHVSQTLGLRDLFQCEVYPRRSHEADLHIRCRKSTRKTRTESVISQSDPWMKK